MIYKRLSYLLTLSLAILWSCDRGPKVIPVSKSEDQPSSGVFERGQSPDLPELPGSSPQKESLEDIHTVKVKEVLTTEKYVYLFVEEEGSEDFWVATRKVNVEVGQTYFYRGGLLKTNYHSYEHNRTFDRIYLVSQVVAANHGSQPHQMETSNEQPAQAVAVDEKKAPAGTTKISDIVSQPEKYHDKEVLLYGQCTKVNANIMGRNWLHIKDGSMDDYDMVITSSDAIAEGQTASFKGKVTLNKDFGAGYKYAIIIEEGVINP